MAQQLHETTHAHAHAHAENEAVEAAPTTGAGAIAFEELCAFADPDPADVALLLLQYPRDREAILARAHELLGNRAVAEIVALEDEPDHAIEGAPEPLDPLQRFLKLLGLDKLKPAPAPGPSPQPTPPAPAGELTLPEVEAINRANVRNVVRFDRATHGAYARPDGQLDAIRVKEWQRQYPNWLTPTGIVDNDTCDVAENKVPPGNHPAPAPAPGPAPGPQPTPPLPGPGPAPTPPAPGPHVGAPHVSFVLPDENAMIPLFKSREEVSVTVDVIAAPNTPVVLNGFSLDRDGAATGTVAHFSVDGAGRATETISVPLDLTDDSKAALDQTVIGVSPEVDGAHGTAATRGILLLDLRPRPERTKR